MRDCGYYKGSKHVTFDQLNEDFDAAGNTQPIDLPVDSVMGLCTSEQLLEQLHDYYKTTDKKTYLVASDVVNLSQLNDVLGRSTANDVIRHAVDIHREEIAKLNTDSHAVFRVYGDNAIFLLEGDDFTEEDLREALRIAEQRVDEFMSQSGLEYLQHPRMKNVTGTGLSTTFVEINKFSGTLTETRNDTSFQLDMGMNMKPRRTRNSIPAEELVTETFLKRVQKALEDQRKPEPAKSVFSAPSGFSYEQARIAVGSRYDEVDALKAATEVGNHKIMRLNLFNLGGLNSVMGHEDVDSVVLSTIMARIQTNIQKHFNNDGTEHARIFDRGGAEHDILLELSDVDEASLHAFKKDIQHELHDALFGKTLAELESEYNLDVDFTKYSPNTKLGEIPHKRGNIPSSGLTMVHVDVNQGDHFVDVFQKLEAERRIHEYHGAAFIVPSEDGRLGMAKIGQGNDGTLNFENRKLDTDKGITSYAWSLADQLSMEQTKATFNKPVGLIYEALTGITLQPVLRRQRTIFRLIDHGVSIDDIKANMGSQEAFDQFVSDTMGEQNIDTIDMSGRPSTRPHGHPEFLTFNLAEQWGYIPDEQQGIENTCLKVQAAIRAASEIEGYVNGYENSLSAENMTELRIRAETILQDARATDSALLRAQYVDHSMRLLKHNASAQGTLDRNPQAIQAAYSLLKSTLIEAATDFENMGLPNLAEKVQSLASAYHLGPRAMESEHAFAVLGSELGKQSCEPVLATYLDENAVARAPVHIKPTA